MQRNFNDSVNASTKNISLHELMDKVNFDRFIAIGTTFPYNTKIIVCEKVVKQYLTAISFGYAKKEVKSILLPSRRSARNHFVQI